ncbi:MAG: hypothetical protein ACKOZL_09360 [Actinomycetes bacterium]
MRRRALILVAAASVLLAACRVDTTLVVRMRASGGGEVAVRIHLDPAARRAAEVDGRRLEDAVRIDDLEAAGWRVRGWRRSGGGATLTVAKAFADPDEAGAILREVTGDAAIVRTFDLGHRDGGLRDTYRVHIDLDAAALRSGLAEDPALAARVRAAGVDPAAVAAALDRTLTEDLRLAAEARLPGSSPQRATPVDGSIALDATSTEWHWGSVVLALGGAVLLLGALAIVVASIRAQRRRPRGRHSPGARRHLPHEPDEDPTLRLPKGGHGAHAPRRRHGRPAPRG